MNESYLVGVDLGTGACKALVASQECEFLGFGSAAYPARDTEAQWVEQDPRALLNGLVEAVRTALERAHIRDTRQCAGLSVGGALHSLMALGAHDTALTGVMTWADTRAAAAAERLRQADPGRALYERTGCPIHAMYPLAKLIWLREERVEEFERAACFISAKEYVTLKLTGHRVVDYATAGGTGLLDTRSLKWDSEALDIAGITPDQLFDLERPEQALGTLRSDFAAAMGLPPTTPVVLGSADAVNSSLGAGAVRASQSTCMVGTSGALRLITPEPVLDPDGRSWCYTIDPKHWLVGGAINNGGLALQWLRDTLRNVREDISFDELTRWAGSAEPGADGLVCLPLLTGERSPYWDSTVRGVLLGLSLNHDHRHWARSFIEGVCFAMRNVLEVLDAMGETVEEVRASGGFARSPLWLQTMADVLGRRLLVPDQKETSSIGAWFWAMRGAGYVESLEEAERFVSIEAVYHPDPENAKRYEELHRIQTAVYPALKDVSKALADYRRSH